MPRFRRAGFTIIELMIVTAILGILASIALPKFGTMIDKAREAVLKGQLGAMRSALNIYYVDNDMMYPAYWLTNFIAYPGIIAIHPKYIDMNNITFYIPGYARAPGAKGAYHAIDLYKTGFGINNLNNFSNSDPVGPFPIANPAPFPNYYCWNPAGGGTYMRTYAKIWMNTWDVTKNDYLLDLYGRAWSLW